jgi:hypothetical protein
VGYVFKVTPTQQAPHPTAQQFQLGHCGAVIANPLGNVTIKQEGAKLKQPPALNEAMRKEANKQCRVFCPQDPETGLFLVGKGAKWEDAELQAAHETLKKFKQVGNAALEQLLLKHIKKRLTDANHNREKLKNLEGRAKQIAQDQKDSAEWKETFGESYEKKEAPADWICHQRGREKPDIKVSAEAGGTSSVTVQRPGASEAPASVQSPKVRDCF